MDKSSQNIVIFIATITISALILMAAYQYRDVLAKPEAAPVPQTQAVPPLAPVDQAALDPDSSGDPEELPEEDGFPMMGEPTVNIDQSSDTAQYGATAPAPEPQTDPLAEPPAESAAITDPYVANN